MGYEFDAFYKGVGCRKCRNTGYSGRCGVHELLMIDDRLRDGIVGNMSILDLRRIALAAGMITLQHDGFRKVREGLTTIEEIIHVTGDIVGLHDRKVEQSEETAATSAVAAGHEA